MELRNKVALVTGGAHRLGRATALALAGVGARVIIHYHQSGDQAEQTLADLRACGVEAHGIAGDLSQVADVEWVIDEAVSQWGQLDVLVNNAGIWGRTPVGQVSAERWDELINTNLRSGFFAAQRAAPALRKARGAIVNIADVGVLRPWKNYAPYLISKAGVVMMTETLARDLAPDVRVNAIAPGVALLPDDASEEEAQRTARTVPLGRIGTPEDVAEAVVFLAQAPYITGVLLPVDGGQRLMAN